MCYEEIQCFWMAQVVQGGLEDVQDDPRSEQAKTQRTEYEPCCAQSKD